jgi:hypothetical protein
MVSIDRPDPDEELHESFYRSMRYRETAMERYARELADGDEVCVCTPAWCFTRCGFCMDLPDDLPCPGAS